MVAYIGMCTMSDRMYFRNAFDFQRPAACIMRSEAPSSANCVVFPILNECVLKELTFRFENSKHLRKKFKKMILLIGLLAESMNTGPGKVFLCL